MSGSEIEVPVLIAANLEFFVKRGATWGDVEKAYEILTARGFLGNRRTLITADGYELDTYSRILERPEHPPIENIQLGQVGVLAALMRVSPQVLTREEIMHAANIHPDIGPQIVDVYVGQLRKRLGDKKPFSIIKNVRGVGYSFG